MAAAIAPAFKNTIDSNGVGRGLGQKRVDFTPEAGGLGHLSRPLLDNLTKKVTKLYVAYINVLLKTQGSIYSNFPNANSYTRPSVSLACCSI